MAERPDASEIEVRRLAEDDAEALIACIRRCYGESYPEADFYDPDVIREMLRSKRLLSSVAVTPEGRVVGHIGTRIPIPGEPVAETLAGIVDPDYRGLGLLPRIGGMMIAGYREMELAGALHIATGAHDRTQRLIVRSGGVATGVLLGHVPAGTDYRGIDHAFGDARIGAIVYYQAFGSLPPLDVFVPARYADRIALLHRELGLDREILSGDACVTQGDPLRGTVHHDPRSGVSVLRFGTLAGPAPEPADALIERELPRCGELVYADVPIADPRAPALIDRLRASGAGFAALHPGSRASEALRMQRTGAAKIVPDAIIAASPGAQALLEWIRVDCADAARNADRPALPH